jgi:predicted Zn-dependent protease
MMIGGNAWARILATDLEPLVTRNYQPVDPDERGLWHSCERLEEALATSKRRIQDPAFSSYLTDLVLSLTESVTSNVRVYPMWEADFNAVMFPNGAMVVNSGLLARMRNEAQLGAVLGHECGHYLRLHSLKNRRNLRAKGSAAAFIDVGVDIATGATGASWIDLAKALNASLLLSVFRYSRELESEADAFGLKLLVERNYPPEAAGEVWSQLIEEFKASARARNMQYVEGKSAVSTHPPPSDRMRDLTQTAEHYRMRASGDRQFDARRRRYLDAIRGLRPRLIEEQVKLNDPGASLYLLDSLAQDGWDGLLRYYEGEVYRMRNALGDADRAREAYALAVTLPDAPPEAYRAHGYAMLRSGSHQEGKAALRRYLELAPGASDAAMIEFTLNQ